MRETVQIRAKSGLAAEAEISALLAGYAERGDPQRIVRSSADHCGHEVLIELVLEPETWLPDTAAIWVQRGDDAPFRTTIGDVVASNWPIGCAEVRVAIGQLRRGRAARVGGGAATLVTLAPGETLGEAIAAVWRDREALE